MKQEENKKKKKTQLVGLDTKSLANTLHRDEHKIINNENPDHKAEYYYYMACWLYNDLMEELQKIKNLIKKKKKRPSAYNSFIGEKMKEGISMIEAVKLWKNDKRRK
jgi:hypothetical protein